MAAGSAAMTSWAPMGASPASAGSPAASAGWPAAPAGQAARAPGRRQPGGDAVQVSGRDPRLRGRKALREQRPGQPGQHVTGAGRGQPRGPGRVHEHRAAAPVRHHRGRSLEQDGHAEPVRRAAGMLQPPGLDGGRFGAEQPGQFPGVRRDQRRRLPRQQAGVLAQDGQPVRVDQDRQVGAQDRGQPRHGVRPGAHARPGHPGLDAAHRADQVPARVIGVGGQHRLGPGLADRPDRNRRGHHPDHPGTAAHGPAGGQHDRPAEPVAARQHADDPPAVLVRFRSRAGQQPGDVLVLRGHGGGLAGQVRAQPDVDELHGSRVPGAGVDEQARLDRAERHRDVGSHGRAVDRAGVGVDAAGQVDSHHGGPLVHGALSVTGQAVEGFPQPAASADAEQPVDDHLGAGDDRAGRGQVTGHAAARGQQFGGAARMGLRPGGDRGHRGAAAGQQGARVQRVAAVVSASGQHRHPGTVNMPRVARQH